MTHGAGGNQISFAERDSLNDSINMRGTCTGVDIKLLADISRVTRYSCPEGRGERSLFLADITTANVLG